MPEARQSWITPGNARGQSTPRPTAPEGRVVMYYRLFEVAAIVFDIGETVHVREFVVD